MRVIRNKRFNAWAREHLKPPTLSYGDESRRTTFTLVVGGGGVVVEQKSERFGWQSSAMLTARPRDAWRFLWRYALSVVFHWYIEDGGLYDRLVGMDWDDPQFGGDEVPEALIRDLLADWPGADPGIEVGGTTHRPDGDA